MENPRIIVSMTSHGQRLQFIDSTLKSILKQKMQADLITVTLTKEDQDELSTKIRDFLTKNNIEIIIADEDLHSHEKYYYAMKKYPNDIIITIDDDIEYNNKLIENEFITNELKNMRGLFNECHELKEIILEQGKVIQQLQSQVSKLEFNIKSVLDELLTELIENYLNSNRLKF